MSTSYELVGDEETGDVELQDLDQTDIIKVLNVRTQETKSVRVKRDGDVASLMRIIESQFSDAPFDRQRLITAGKVLRPEDTLKSHKLLSTTPCTVHLSVRPANARQPTASSASTSEGEVINPLAAVDALSSALAVANTTVDGAATTHNNGQTLSQHRQQHFRGDSAIRAAARVRLLSSLLALYCALNSLTALLDATTPDSLYDDDNIDRNAPKAEPDEHAVVEIALNVGGLWVGGAGLRASRYLDLPSAERYDKALRIYAVSTLAYEAYYRMVYLPDVLADEEEDGVFSLSNNTTLEERTDDYASSSPSFFGDDDRGAGTRETDPEDDGQLDKDSQVMSGFVTLLLMSAIWLICVQNSARLRAEIRGLQEPSIVPPLVREPFARLDALSLTFLNSQD